ncbi:unnamed protein product, partial [Rotaria magnacalcarata]
MDLNEQGILLPAPLRVFDCSANEIISFKLNNNKMDLNEQGILLPAPLRVFDCSANEIISFKLIRSEKDLHNEENEFEPEFTHQIFGE